MANFGVNWRPRAINQQDCSSCRPGQSLWPTRSPWPNALYCDLGATLGTLSAPEMAPVPPAESIRGNTYLNSFFLLISQHRNGSLRGCPGPFQPRPHLQLTKSCSMWGQPGILLQLQFPLLTPHTHYNTTRIWWALPTPILEITAGGSKKSLSVCFQCMKLITECFGLILNVWVYCVLFVLATAQLLLLQPATWAQNLSPSTLAIGSDAIGIQMSVAYG